jgi:hypothetical protein
MTPTEQSGQKSAATLEEAMAMQDQMAREANNTVAEEGEADQQASAEENQAALEEAGKAQEARDDEVYGREPGGEDRRIGYANVPGQEPAEAATGETPEVKAESKSQTKDTQQGKSSK